MAGNNKEANKRDSQNNNGLGSHHMEKVTSSFFMPQNSIIGNNNAGAGAGGNGSSQLPKAISIEEHKRVPSLFHPQKIIEEVNEESSDKEQSQPSLENAEPINSQNEQSMIEGSRDSNQQDGEGGGDESQSVPGSPQVEPP